MKYERRIDKAMKERKIFYKGERTPEQLEKKKKFQQRFRYISAVVLILALVGITYLLYPIFKGFGDEGWLESIQERISSYSGIWGVLIFLLIQTMQVLIAVIPAIQVVGGVLYGWFFGALLSFAGIVLGSLIVWGIVKKLGTPLVEAIVSEKHMKKFRFLEDDRKLITILVLLYVIPGVPKDVITYIVPLTKVKMKDFFLYVIPWRIPAIVLSTVFGSNVTHGNYKTAIVIVSIILIIAIIGMIFKDKILYRINKLRRHSKKSQTASVNAKNNCDNIQNDKKIKNALDKSDFV